MVDNGPSAAELGLSQHELAFKIPEWKNALPKELPNRTLVEHYAPKDEWFLDKDMTRDKQHDEGHLLRTFVLAEILTEKLLDQNPDLKINREAVRWAAVIHDTQRASDYEIDQKPHGIRAEKWARYAFAKEHPELDEETIDLISKICKYHTPGYNDPEPYPIELKIIQDADTLEAERGAIQFVHKLNNRIQRRIDSLSPSFADRAQKVFRGGMSRGGGLTRLVQNRVKNHYHGTMRTEGAKDLFPAAREFVIASMKNYNEYMKDPIGNVLQAGEQIGLIKAA